MAETVVVVFSYNRPEMLRETLLHLNQYDATVIVIDDGSRYDTSAVTTGVNAVYYRRPHMGKQNWFEQWNFAFKLIRKIDAHHYVFMPDDFQRLDLQSCISAYNEIKGKSTLNLINDGREQWGSVPEQISDTLINCGFNDCGFICNKEILRLLKWRINPTNSSTESSGVGRQLTNRLGKMGIKMYCPVKSFAYHGEHESVMHPELRKQKPIISR
jgi:hypothetical protein